MFPFYIRHKIPISSPDSGAIFNSLKGTIKGRKITIESRGKLVVQKKSLFYDGVFDNDVIIKLKENNLIVTISNPWSLTISVIFTIVLSASIFNNHLDGNPPQWEFLIYLAFAWILPSTVLLLTNYLFIIPLLRHIRRKVTGPTPSS
ncbi:MAG: hypothetical protein JJU02_16650 [Cryomorphaceae bacterium]|nr:hypothetical protein [Cryomorphaceae bacterium]